MKSFIVEAYVPCSQSADAHAAALALAAVADELTRTGTKVRHVATTFLPDDETCFHLFEAASAEAVEEVSRRAGLGERRVLRAVTARSRAVGDGFIPPDA